MEVTIMGIIKPKSQKLDTNWRLDVGEEKDMVVQFKVWREPTGKTKVIKKRGKYFTIPEAKNTFYLLYDGNTFVEDSHYKSIQKKFPGVLAAVRRICRKEISLLECLADDIDNAYKAKNPFSMSGKSGLYNRRAELSREVKWLTFHKMIEIVKYLLQENTITRYTDEKNKTKKYLKLVNKAVWDKAGCWRKDYVTSIDKEN
jgi:hypothetical protein